MPTAPDYLRPYHDARHARGRRSLLWLEPEGQEVRFEAIARHCPLAGLTVLDAGCGRADFLGYLRARGIFPAHYTGLEALPWLARAARRKGYSDCRILEGDFVRQPEALRAGADVIVFSGSLNLLPSRPFYRALRAAWAAAPRWLVFNFLSSPEQAAADWLFWHRPERVLAFARSTGAKVHTDDTYLEGDCTVVMRRRRRSAGTWIAKESSRDAKETA
jgi:SAM-dependent methyltransferase